MKVLLLGDYSGFQYNLAQGLKKIGVDVTLASTGDGWKNIPRDIDIKQPEKYKRLRFGYKLLKNYRNFIGYDVVQLVSPNFIMSSPWFTNKFFNLLKYGNDKFFVCATGMDYHYVSYALTGKLKYSVFYSPVADRDQYVSDMKKLANNIPLKKLEEKICNFCSGIISTSIGYQIAYENSFPEKTKFIPLPINTDEFKYCSSIAKNTKQINFFLGLMKDRMRIKGTDKIYSILQQLKKRYPNDVNLSVVDSVPYKEYINMIDSSHILCDQLYAYGIGMNGLIAQSKGLIVGGGADEDLYSALGEFKNRPILDLNTSDKEMFKTFENLLESRNNLIEQSLNSRKFVVDNYDYIKVAQQYLDFWKSK